MKPPVSPELRQQVLELRRFHSLSEVATQTGLPIGTVKTLCSRSGAFRDNLALRELFTLPPIKPSDSKALAVPLLPWQDTVTGDKELDAVLWLREVIKTGQVALIEKAMLAAKQIKTPLAELEKRYTNHLVSKNPNDWVASLRSINFADLDDLAKRSIRNLTLQTEATARFGNDLHIETPAERFCIDALAGLEPVGGFRDETMVNARFSLYPKLMPNTLSDCLFELAYWHDLYLLRHAITGDDQRQEAFARECFVFRCMANIRPRSNDEGIAVFRYLAGSDRMAWTETNRILQNLIGHRAGSGMRCSQKLP